MALVSSRSFVGREDNRQEGEAVPEYRSKERVERDGVLLYIEGDPIDPNDEQTLRDQGFLKQQEVTANKKARAASTNKARKAAKNK